MNDEQVKYLIIFGMVIVAIIVITKIVFAAIALYMAISQS